MSTWNTTTYDADGKLVAHLRLGAYLPTEEDLKPSQFTGSFSSSDGLFLTTTGDHYLNADKAVQIEAKDTAEVVIGDFNEDTGVDLKIDVTDSGAYATFKGKGVAINAVPTLDEAKAPTDNELQLYASEKVAIQSGGETRFESAGNVYIANQSETSTDTQSKTLTMGLSESVTWCLYLDIVTGFDISIMAGISTSITIYSSETAGTKLQYTLRSNGITFASSKNTGASAFTANLFGLIGALMQENQLAEVKQKDLANGVTGGKLVNKLVGTQTGAVGSNVGVHNNM